MFILRSVPPAETMSIYTRKVWIKFPVYMFVRPHHSHKSSSSGKSFAGGLVLIGLVYDGERQ